MPRHGRRRRLQELQLQQHGQRYIILPLEQMLRAWQDVCRLYYLMHTKETALGRQPGFSNTGAIANFEALPGFLLTLHSRPEEETLRELAMFAVPTELDPFGKRPVGVPDLLYGWTRYRRVWYVSDELQAVLRTASLTSVRLEDIRFPLPSFCLQIGRPIPTPDGGAVDFFIVTGAYDGSPRLTVAALDVRRSQYQPLSARQTQQLSDCAQHNDWNALRNLITRYQQPFNGSGPGYKLVMTAVLILIDAKTFEKEPVVKVADHLPRHGEYVEDEGAAWGEVSNQITQLVCRFALYMSALHPDDQQQHLRDVHPAADRGEYPDRKRITEGSQITMVSSVYKVAPAEQHELFEQIEGRREGPHRQMPMHARRRHRRRKARHGDDPAAWNDPDLVLDIPACLVRKDRKTSPGAPGGSIHIL